jgi:hypothetical protein
MPDEASRKLRVFISYSRDDLVFADQLDIALKFCGFSSTIDRHGISGGEDWKRRLSNLIREADTIVFVLSPSSATSKICEWEVEESTRLGKRIIPVASRALNGASPPSRLKDLNYIFFYDEPTSPGSGFGSGLERIANALNTDLDWLREHTRLLQRATEWDEGGRPTNRLLSGTDITDAKAWATRRPSGAPEPTSLHLDFLRVSEEAELFRHSEERKRLEDMAAAQAERALALEKAETAQREREVALDRSRVALKKAARSQSRLAWGGATTLVVFVAIGWWAYGVINEKRLIDREAAREDLRGQIVAQATAEGEDALDTAEGHKTSPYSTALVKKLNQQGRSLVEGLIDAHQNVTELSKGRQRPSLSVNLNGHIYLWRQPPSRRKRALIISTDSAGIVDLRLQAPEHDAAAMFAMLVGAGFRGDEILQLRNPERDAIEGAITNLGNQLNSQAASGKGPIQGLAATPDNSLLLVFFSGNGVELEGVNYLLPSPPHGAFDTSNDIQNHAVSVPWLTQAARRSAAASVIILDTMFNRVQSDPVSKQLSVNTSRP